MITSLFLKGAYGYPDTVPSLPLCPNDTIQADAGWSQMYWTCFSFSHIYHLNCLREMFLVLCLLICLRLGLDHISFSTNTCWKVMAIKIAPYVGGKFSKIPNGSSLNWMASSKSSAFCSPSLNPSLVSSFLCFWQVLQVFPFFWSLAFYPPTTINISILQLCIQSLSVFLNPDYFQYLKIE